MKGRTVLTIGLALLVMSGCATVDVAPATQGGVIKEEDEKSLWAQSDRIAEQMRSGRMVYRDENLSAYINSVGRSLFTPDVLEKIPFEITVIRDPRLNAFALPTGDVFLHSGIIAKMENEAQLATLLAHEMTHSTHRHSIQSLRNLKNQSAFFSIVALGGGNYGAMLGNVGFMASVSGYSRELEREADSEGLKLMVRAGYDPREAPRLFEYLLEELETTGSKEPFFFGTHPQLRERIESYREYIALQGGEVKGDTHAERFLEHANQLVLDNAGLDLQSGRYQVAARGVETYMARVPEDPEGPCLRARIHEQEDPEKGAEKAAASYRRALELDPDHAEAHKGIGMISLKRGDLEEARDHLVRYIELEPDAADRAYMESYLEQIGEDGGGS